MGDHEDGSGHILIHVSQDFQQVFGRPGVQGPGGLIGQDEGLSCNYGAGTGSPLFLPAGNLIGEFVQYICDSQGVGCLLYPLPDFAGRKTVQGEGLQTSSNQWPPQVFRLPTLLFII